MAGERAGGALRGAAAGRAACGGAEPQYQALQVRGAPDPTHAHSKLLSAWLVRHIAQHTVALQYTGCAATSSTSRVWRLGGYKSHLFCSAAVLLLVLPAYLPATPCRFARRYLKCVSLRAPL